MNKGDILTKIEVILPKLHQWITFKEASFEPEEMIIVRELAASLLPGRTISWYCTPCAGEILTTIWSWYLREKSNG